MDTKLSCGVGVCYPTFSPKAEKVWKLAKCLNSWLRHSYSVDQLQRLRSKYSFVAALISSTTCLVYFIWLLYFVPAVTTWPKYNHLQFSTGLYSHYGSVQNKTEPISSSFHTLIQAICHCDSWNHCNDQLDCAFLCFQAGFRIFDVF